MLDNALSNFVVHILPEGGRACSVGFPAQRSHQQLHGANVPVFWFLSIEILSLELTSWISGLLAGPYHLPAEPMVGLPTWCPLRDLTVEPYRVQLLTHQTNSNQKFENDITATFSCIARSINIDLNGTKITRQACIVTWMAVYCMSNKTITVVSAIWKSGDYTQHAIVCHLNAVYSHLLQHVDSIFRDY